jgi:hypothetical protein
MNLLSWKNGSSVFRRLYNSLLKQGYLKYRRRVQYGDVLKVHSIDDIDDKYGIIAHARLGRKKIYFPLCELKVIELNDMERKVIDDYSVWFANR